MKKLKIIIITLLNCINIYLLYSTVGHLILAIKTPKITGDTPTTFMGMYIMSITFGAIFLILMSLTVFLAIKFFRPKKVKDLQSPKNHES